MHKVWTVVLGILVMAVLGPSGPSYGKDDDVLAKVGDEVITRADFETRLKSLGSVVSESAKNMETRRELLEAMIKIRLFAVEAANKGLTGHPDVVARLKMVQDDFISQEYVRNYLAPKVSVSDEEMENYYKTNPDFGEREFLRGGIILVAKESEAREISEALAKGEPFKKLARERSIDPATNLLGGEIDWFEKGKKDREIEEVLTRLEKGKVSEVVKMKNGFAILKLEDRRTEPKPPYLKVKDQISRKLRYTKLTELVEKEMADLKAKIKVDVFDDRLKDEGK